MQKFQDKRMIMHSDVAVLKLKSNIGKKKGSFLDYFFFYRYEAGSSAYIFAQTAVHLRSKIHDVDIPMYTMCTKFRS